MTHHSERMSEAEIDKVHTALAYCSSTIDRDAHTIITQLRTDLAAANEQIDTLRTQLAEAEEALNHIEEYPTDYRVGSDENMERVREIARKALSRLTEARGDAGGEGE